MVRNFRSITTVARPGHLSHGGVEMGVAIGGARRWPSKRSVKIRLSPFMITCEAREYRKSSPARAELAIRTPGCSLPEHETRYATD